MHVVDVAGVDPKLESVAVFQPRVATPGRLRLAFHLDPHGEARLAPRGTDVGPGRAVFEFGQAQQPVRLVRRRHVTGPQRIAIAAGGRKAKQKPRGQKWFGHPMLNGLRQSSVAIEGGAIWSRRIDRIYEIYGMNTGVVNPDGRVHPELLLAF